VPEPRHLGHAPITEALIDVRVRPNPTTSASSFEVGRQELATAYPKVNAIHYGRATISLGKPHESSATTEDLGPQGFYFKSDDESDVVQFRVDGFTFNRLRPYTSWEEIFPRAMELWGLYARIARPEVATRLALRYINHVELPGVLENLGTFLTAAPFVPPGLPPYISEFLTRVVLHDPENDLTGILAQALQGNPSGKENTLVLDIDVFREGEFEPMASAFGETFGALRTFKNQIFFSSLTEETIRRFE